MKPKESFRRRWLRRGLLGLGALLLLALAGAAGAVWRTLPPDRAELRLPGLSAPVEIALGAAGVPRIRAATEADAWRAMGWLHARDRLFQMDLMRRGASGRLSEIAGPATLPSDRLVRLLGLAQRAEADLATLPANTRAVLEAYAAGVNAWIAARGRFAAPEFLLLGAPEPWRPADSLLWGKLMGLWLSGNWRVELDRARLLAAGLPIERLWDLWPADTSPGRPDGAIAAGAAPRDSASSGESHPARAERATADGARLDAAHLGRLAAAVPAWPPRRESGGGGLTDAPLPPSASNAWAVAPGRSASGGALLASDPHLGYGAPILWYLARIELPGGRFLAGATSPGVPMIVIGRNERLAWGFTTTHSDVQDVFVERLGAAPGTYDTPDGPQPFRIREERIRVRGGPDEVLRVRETRHGPVISDLDPAFDPTHPAALARQGGRGEGTVLAVAMANLAPGDSAAAGLLALNRARGVAAAREAAALITSPPQNLMVADADGRIALFLTGRTPIRRGGADGSLPRPGWDGAADWEGWIPFDAMPHVVDPPGGVLANANNRVAPADGGAFLGRDWFGDWRFRRIGALLGAGPRHHAAEFAAMQTDTVSLFAREVLPALLRLTPRPAGPAGRAYDLLAAWDGGVDADRPEPLIFHAWLRAFGRAALAAGGVPEGGWAPTPEFLRFLLLGPADRAAAWCGGGERGGCAGLAAAALEAAVAAQQRLHGDDPASWRWGAVHVVRFEHSLLRFVPLLGRLTGLAAATPGDGETVRRGTPRGGTGPDPFANVHGAGLRAVFDLGDRDGGGAFAVIATGQSGHPLSPHWGDQFGRWRDGGALLPLDGGSGGGPDARSGERGGGWASGMIRLLP